LLAELGKLVLTLLGGIKIPARDVRPHLMNAFGSLARSNSRFAKFIGMTRSSSP
jgi:hypothetical protein